ncbi:MAG: hypothetical protein QM764_16965 [Chitinophagaceae bacterium]
MISTTRYFFVALFITLATTAFSQSLWQFDTVQHPKKLEPEFRRLINHEAIDKEQTKILNSDGKADNLFSASTNDEVNFFVTAALVNKVDALQYKIEKDTVLDHRLKVQYLKGLENVLRYFGNSWKTKLVSPSSLPAIINGYEACMQRDIKKESIEPVINDVPYDAGVALLRADIFDKNPGFQVSQYDLFRKYCSLNPDKILSKLNEDSNYPFTDSLIKAAAYRSPSQLYDFAAAGNKLGYTIRKINDPLIGTVSRMATNTSGRLYFPFLDNIVKGQMSFTDIDAVKNDSIRYYKLMVKTHLDYVKRTLNRDTANGYSALNDMLRKKAEEVFVNTINGLHENPNPAIRFKILQSLSAEELYYLAVYTDGIIYTSSFVAGVYPMMMSRINQRGDSLLMRLNFDKYRKFIKMCAAYNTLSNFLSTFSNPDDAKKVMQAFVSNLEKSKGLEDGVDVADSYASVAETNKAVADEMLLNVRYNFQRNLLQNNKRGMVIYNLLHKLFLSADSTNNIDLSKELGIPPIYNVDYSKLADDSGRVVQQVFFYGDEDKDGQNSYINFLGMFRNKTDWTVTDNNPDWIWIHSNTGKPVWIFANKPLYGQDDPDAKAQEKLDQYLAARNLKPTIFIHRGHSFHVKYSLAQIQPSARIVVLGSCGGYNNLNDVLTISPDAHIISSKQVGTKTVNEPILQSINNTLRAGKDIDWLPMWKDLSKQFTGAAKEKFDDYIPPYKNLGAIFIKAYRISMGDDE